jgi:hypothetical protein
VSKSEDSERLFALLAEVKELARDYYELTRKPLGVTAEIAEYEAARHLNLDLAPARTPGYDAIRPTAEGDQQLQIKGRCILPGSKPGQRIGKINLEKPWDAVLLVLLNERFDPTEIYEADRPAVTAALSAPGSKARNERGQMAVSQFKSIGHKVWPPK